MGGFGFPLHKLLIVQEHNFINYLLFFYLSSSLISINYYNPPYWIIENLYSPSSAAILPIAQQTYSTINICFEFKCFNRFGIPPFFTTTYVY